jgi:hypothetical protein
VLIPYLYLFHFVADDNDDNASSVETTPNVLNIAFIKVTFLCSHKKTIDAVLSNNRTMMIKKNMIRVLPSNNRVSFQTAVSSDVNVID